MPALKAHSNISCLLASCCCFPHPLLSAHASYYTVLPVLPAFCWHPHPFVCAVFELHFKNQALSPAHTHHTASRHPYVPLSPQPGPAGVCLWACAAGSVQSRSAPGGCYLCVTSALGDDLLLLPNCLPNSQVTPPPPALPSAVLLCL
jgi:hypothetical protein